MSIANILHLKHFTQCSKMLAKSKKWKNFNYITTPLSLYTCETLPPNKYQTEFTVPGIHHILLTNYQYVNLYLQKIQNINNKNYCKFQHTAFFLKTLYV